MFEGGDSRVGRWVVVLGVFSMLWGCDGEMWLEWVFFCVLGVVCMFGDF